MVTDYRPSPAELLAPGNFRRIARRAKVAPQHVSRVIQGAKGASFHVAARIAFAAGVTLDDLYEHIRNSPLLVIRGRRTRGDKEGAMVVPVVPSV